MKRRIRIRSKKERTSIHAVNTISIEEDPIHQSFYIFITSIWGSKKSISEHNIRSRNSIVYARHHNIPCQSIQIHHVHLVDFCPWRSPDFAFCGKMQFVRHHWRRHNRKRKKNDKRYNWKSFQQDFQLFAECSILRGRGRFLLCNYVSNRKACYSRCLTLNGKLASISKSM